MPTIKDLGDRCHRILSAELAPGERIVAQGRADAVRHLSEVPRGSGYTYLLVTSERILWTNFIVPVSVASLPLAAVSSYAEGTYQHRYVIALRHRPLERVEWRPRWRLLWWRWGNAPGPTVKKETIFEFSRRETAAAKALRDALARRGFATTERLRLRRPPPRHPPRPLVAVSYPAELDVARLFLKGLAFAVPFGLWGTIFNYLPRSDGCLACAARAGWIYAIVGALLAPGLVLWLVASPSGRLLRFLGRVRRPGLRRVVVFGTVFGAFYALLFWALTRSVERSLGTGAAMFVLFMVFPWLLAALYRRELEW